MPAFQRQYLSNKAISKHFLEVAQVLWGWQLCVDCSSRRGCATETCPSRRCKRLEGFLEYYNDMVSSFMLDAIPDEQLAIRDHGDLFRIIQELKSTPDATRFMFGNRLFGTREEGLPLRSDQERAINLAVKVMLMINCASERRSLDMLEQGNFQAPWRDDVPFSQYISDLFPETDHPEINSNDHDFHSFMDMKSKLSAKKLKKHAGLKFKPTDDLKSHLRLDSQTGEVEIFHHTAFLKEHLRLTKDQPKSQSVTDALKLGALPRQLALEGLDTIQKVLFPISDPKSRSLLKSLIATSSFDPDCLRFESASIRNPDEKDISYHYFGARLAHLSAEVENPRPRSWIERWLERKSGARYVMMATVIGVAFAVLLGIASLAVSSYQAWLSYQQWQHPVTTGTGR